MNNKYFNKYLKYKQKYLNLVKKGGAQHVDDNEYPVKWTLYIFPVYSPLSYHMRDLDLQMALTTYMSFLVKNETLVTPTLNNNLDFTDTSKFYYHRQQSLHRKFGSDWIIDLFKDNDKVTAPKCYFVLNDNTDLVFTIKNVGTKYPLIECQNDYNLYTELAHGKDMSDQQSNPAIREDMIMIYEKSGYRDWKRGNRNVIIDDAGFISIIDIEPNSWDKMNPKYGRDKSAEREELQVSNYARKDFFDRLNTSSFRERSDTGDYYKITIPFATFI